MKAAASGSKNYRLEVGETLRKAEGEPYCKCLNLTRKCVDWQRLESPAKQGLHLQLQDSVKTAPEKVPYTAQDASVKELKKKRAPFVLGTWGWLSSGFSSMSIY